MRLTEEQHQARWDAETLAQAERIKADKSRLNNATNAAKQMAEEENKQAQAMRKVAGMKERKPVESKVTMQGKVYDSGFAVQKTKQGNDFNVFKKI